jgi:hypothetical protein
VTVFFPGDNSLRMLDTFGTIRKESEPSSMNSPTS